MDITSKAVEFLKPYIESNNFWIPIFWYIGVGALILLCICFWIEGRNNDRFYHGEGFVWSGIATGVIASIVCLIVILILKIENFDMKKFPVKHYNEKTRFVEER